MGSRKIAAKLQEEGYKVGRKLVRSYMREMAIYAIYPKPNLSKNDGKEGVLPYLLRYKTALFPNQYWSIDITYIKMYRHHMYLTAIIDWYSRKIVGWRLADTLETNQVLEAVRDAVERYGTPAILNSDQGSQFTSTEYKSLLKELHIRQSMDGKSRWADNIMIERWFRSLKTERIYINEYHNPRELRSSIQDYIHSYNTFRPHQALDYATPDEVYYASFTASPDADLDSAPAAC
jgi:putative transposase